MRRPGRKAGPRLVAVALAALPCLAGCGFGGLGQDPPPQDHPPFRPAHASPLSSVQADLLAAARQTAHTPVFDHATQPGEDHWSVADVRFFYGGYTVRTACVGDGTLTATATGAGTWHTRCTARQVTVDQVTRTTLTPVTFTFTATKGVRFAVVGVA
ncbi:hypothetical protein K7472_26720 [Streptomyces sp. PTM05]|uniref:Lipoprotein n=1 Tax=Streptantibioticus parmotrematis TaxID=2873249 RepID=A0ABS7QZP7_9ACTN|nr:hypothetical protein [Streptantibioticus parmotrematis]MBY8888408.1 hypothetical protein [Streptantibioticus parmotrematis]